MEHSYPKTWAVTHNSWFSKGVNTFANRVANKLVLLVF